MDHLKGNRTEKPAIRIRKAISNAHRTDKRYIVIIR